MTRVADHEILPLILNRHSPRALSGEPLPQAELLRVLEAARWAPSAMNIQPWRFLYAQAGTTEFARFVDFLLPFNADWAGKAGALVVVMSNTVMPDGKPFAPHAFDTGAAWMALALQAASMGLVAHAMGGVAQDKIRAELQVPDTFTIHCVVALGFKGNFDDLPERLKPREAPNERRPIAESIANGAFPDAWK